MIAHGVTPILNVTDITASFGWFERLGWRKLWDWGEPPSFGAVGSGKVEIFLCQNGQGGRGVGTNKTTFGDEQENDKGCWMSVWVDDVDTIHQHCLANDIEVTMPPTNEPWNVRELHIRHPDGHVFRISKGIECEED
ncbi:MAG: bleomycin resistance family protein [Acidobacteria bacterium]|nr:bleomycin resistance family protein [Acidobacteriota bacterium]